MEVSARFTSEHEMLLLVPYLLNMIKLPKPEIYILFFRFVLNVFFVMFLEYHCSTPNEEQC